MRGSWPERCARASRISPAPTRAAAPARPPARATGPPRTSATRRSGRARGSRQRRAWRAAKLRALASPPAPPPPASGLESPTSTLSFSESALFAGAAHDHVHGAARAPAVLTPHSYGEAFGEQHRFGDYAATPGFLAGVLLDCAVAGTEQRFAAASANASVLEQQEEEEAQVHGAQAAAVGSKRGTARPDD
ncbi:uncharacterized protein LOC120669114 [Panicum virgatum]|uniref:uncharacterized protein LOC120669114 n=1 Tax=Panicum virgatum TaxID=38727 RepID=UPI0019D57A47|nr:uncharacterized protein LOC120669114 [Panicum virgatum]